LTEHLTEIGLVLHQENTKRGQLACASVRTFHGFSVATF
jgi:hypothetical protein